MLLYRASVDSCDGKEEKVEIPIIIKDNKKLEIKDTDKNSFARLMIDFVEENL